MLIGFTPGGLGNLPSQDIDSLGSLGFPLPPSLQIRPVNPSLCSLRPRPSSEDGPPSSQFECIGSSVFLRRCRASVLQAYDFLQLNLKAWARRLQACWSAENADGGGIQTADLLRETELRTCELERDLQKARSEPMENGPIWPPCQVKTLGELSPAWMSGGDLKDRFKSSPASLSTPSKLTAASTSAGACAVVSMKSTRSSEK